MRRDYDAIVVGAGPAGCATAMLLARHGHRILLLDRATFPRRKLCTHAIMPAGLPVLERLGVLASIEAAGAARWYGARLWLNGVQFEADFPTQKVAYPYGLSLRREYLDEILLDAARAVPEIDVQTGSAVTGLIRRDGQVNGVRLACACGSGEAAAPLTILAGGRTTALARDAGLATIALPNQHTALMGYLAGVTSEDRPAIEGFYWHGRSASLLPADNGLRVGGIMAAPDEWPHADAAEHLLAELRRYPSLQRRLEGARVISAPTGARGLKNTWRRAHAPGLLLVGDAAMQTDPLFGQGISLALRSADWASEAAEGYLRGDLDALARYDRRRIRVLGHRFLAMTGISQLRPGSTLERLFVANAVVNPPSTALVLRLVLGFGTVSREPAPRRTVATWLREAVRTG